VLGRRLHADEELLKRVTGFGLDEFNLNVIWRFVIESGSRGGGSGRCAADSAWLEEEKIEGLVTLVSLVYSNSSRKNPKAIIGRVL
jgi:hypothetical protein